MKDFKRDGGGSFGGRRDDRGGNRYGKPSFGGGRPSFRGRGDDRGGRGSFDGPKQMHETTCSQCGKRCEVPFRPTGEKPVYCRECFTGKEQSPRGDFEKRDWGRDDRSAVKKDFSDPRIGDIKKQLEIVNAKLDQLLAVLPKKDEKSKEKVSEEAPRFTEELKAAEKSKKKTVSKKKKK